MNDLSHLGTFVDDISFRVLVLSSFIGGKADDGGSFFQVEVTRDLSQLNLGAVYAELLEVFVFVEQIFEVRRSAQLLLRQVLQMRVMDGQPHIAV